MTTNNKIISLSIACLLLGSVAWVGLGILFSANDYTTITGEALPVIMQGEAVKLDNINIISGTVLIHDAETIILQSGNYSIDLPAGKITPTVSGSLENATSYTIDYNCGSIDGTVSLLGKLVVGICFMLGIIIIIFKEVGIKIE